MAKAYELMRWLNSEQVVDWLQKLTGTKVSNEQLLGLWKENHCKIYADCEGLDGTNLSSGKPVHPRGGGEILVELYGKLSFTFAAGKLLASGANRVSYPVRIIPTSSPQVGSLPYWDYDPCLLEFTEPREILFNSAEIRALANKMNGAAEHPMTAELEALHQQLEQERARRQAAEQRAQLAEAVIKDENTEIENWRHQATQERTLSENAQAEIADLSRKLEESKDKPSFPLALAALMELLKMPASQTRHKGMSQETIKNEILERFPWRGLGKRNLEKLFALANKAKENAE